MVKQTTKQAKLEINDTEKKNVEKNKEKSIEIDNQESHSDTSVIEDDSEINERDVDFKKDKVNLKDKFGREKVAKYYGAGEKDEESELEKINFEKLAIRSEKENKSIGANTKYVNSELHKKQINLNQ